MTRTLTPLLFLAATGLFAQPTVPQLSLNVGDARLMDLEFPVTEAGAAGANTTWDFSATAFSSGTSLSTAVEAANTPYAAHFPGATMALYVNEPEYGLEVYNYFNMDGGLTTHGGVTVHDGEADMTIYSDPHTYFTTPLTATSSGEDTYASAYNFDGGSVVTTGTSNWEVDGYGTLILPNATYAQVLRIHAVQERTMTTDIGSGPSVSETTTETWFWVNANFPLPLLVVEVYTDEEGESFTGGTAMISFTSGVGIDEVEGQLPLRVHPNPARDAVHLELEASGRVEYRVLDTLGQEVLQGSLAAGGALRHPLDVAALQAGSYLVEVRSPKGLHTARFIKE